MFYLGRAYYVVWGAGQALLLFLIVVLFRSRNYRHYPFFTAYCVGNLSQSVTVLFALRFWGQSLITTEIGWVAVIVTLGARIMAIAELTEHILAKYRGIWGVAWRFIAAGVAGVSCYSFAVANWRWYLGFPSAERLIALALAAFIAMLFVFCRYYRLPISRPNRLMAIAFFVYSGTVVINQSLLEKYYSRYGQYWNLTTTAVFVICVTLWGAALWTPVPEGETGSHTLPRGVYGALSPEINDRLRALDERLAKFWSSSRKKK